jgi:hypothetical protein
MCLSLAICVAIGFFLLNVGLAIFGLVVGFLLVGFNRLWQGCTKWEKRDLRDNPQFKVFNERCDLDEARHHQKGK